MLALFFWQACSAPTKRTHTCLEWGKHGTRHAARPPNERMLALNGASMAPGDFTIRIMETVREQTLPDEESLKRRLYVLEKQLAGRILASRPEDRRRVAREVYAELYREAPWESQIAIGDARHEAGVQWNLDILNPWIPDQSVILDIGCGTGDVLLALAPRSKQCTGVDMTLAVIPTENQFPNLTFRESDILELDFPDHTFDWVLSVHVLEHLHPDDVEGHFQDVCRILRPGGAFFIETPNRLTGPHDFSRDFDPVATGLHLKEWTHRDLAEKLLANGFSRVDCQMLPRRLFKGRPALFQMGRRSVIWKYPLDWIGRFLPTPGMKRLWGRIMQINMVVVCARKDGGSVKP